MLKSLQVMLLNAQDHLYSAEQQISTLYLDGGMSVLARLKQSEASLSYTKFYY